MAGRFSGEYRPTEFVKLPFEEVAKALAMKEGQYQEGYMAPSIFGQQQNAIKTPTQDQVYAQQLTDQAIMKAHQTAHDLYGGDYALAAMDMKRGLLQDASHPFWKQNQNAYEDWEKAKDLDRQLTAQGEKLTFNRSILDDPYYNASTGQVNNNRAFDVEKKLGWTEKMEDIIQKNIYQFQQSNEDSLAKAHKVTSGNIDRFEQLTKGVHGTTANKGAVGTSYDVFKNTAEYTQMKKTLLGPGYNNVSVSDEIKADELIEQQFKDLFKNKLHKEYDTKYTEISVGIDHNKKDGTNPNVPPEPTSQPTTDETTKSGEKARQNILLKIDKYYDVLSKFGTNSSNAELNKLQSQYADLALKGGLGDDTPLLMGLKTKIASLTPKKEDLLSMPIKNIPEQSINALFNSGNDIRGSQEYNELNKYQGLVKNILKSSPNTSLQTIFGEIADIEAQRDGSREITYSINTDDAAKTIKEQATRAGVSVKDNQTFSISDKGKILLYDTAGKKTDVTRSIGSLTNPQTMLLQSLQTVNDINNEYSDTLKMGADPRRIKTKGLFLNHKQYDVQITPGSNIAQLVDPTTGKLVAGAFIPVPDLKQHLVTAFISTLGRE